MTKVANNFEPYFYNCNDCGDPIIEKGQMDVTEKLRGVGLCMKCFRKHILQMKKPLLIVHAPTEKSILN